MDYAVSYRERERSSSRLKRIFVYGRSLGGAVSIYLASTHYKTIICGMILENTFASLKEVLLDILPWFPFIAFFGGKQWNSRELISTIEMPMLFVRSMEDRLVAPWQMLELMKSAARCQLKVDY